MGNLGFSPLPAELLRLLRLGGQRVGGGIRIWSPVWMLATLPRPGFIRITVSYGTPNQLTMLRKLSPARTV